MSIAVCRCSGFAAATRPTVVVVLLFGVVYGVVVVADGVVVPPLFPVMYIGMTASSVAVVVVVRASLFCKLG